MERKTLASRLAVGDEIWTANGPTEIARVVEYKHHLAGYWWQMFAADGRVIATFQDGDLALVLNAR